MASVPERLVERARQLDKRIVLRETGQDGNPVYKKIEPTKTGNYTFYFNKWTKLPELPTFTAEDRDAFLYCP